VLQLGAYLTCDATFELDGPGGVDVAEAGQHGQALLVLWEQREVAVREPILERCQLGLQLPLGVQCRILGKRG
jgi:hypothetical protein